MKSVEQIVALCGDELAGRLPREVPVDRPALPRQQLAQLLQGGSDVHGLPGRIYSIGRSSHFTIRSFGSVCFHSMPPFSP